MTCTSAFWDALAPHLWRIENSHLDLSSLRRFQADLRPPVLVVGAGQGLIVGALQAQGLACDGVDLSAEMIRSARLRRGLDLVHADARALPFGDGAYATILYATGVIDFIGDDETIRAIMIEGRRVAGPSKDIFVAFYRYSPATVEFLTRLGLLRNDVLRFRDILEIYRMTPSETLSWVAKRSHLSYPAGVILALRSWALSSWQEKRNAFHMQRIFDRTDQADALIQAAPESQPYRNESAIRNLFARLAIPVKALSTAGSCHIVQI